MSTAKPPTDHPTPPDLYRSLCNDLKLARLEYLHAEHHLARLGSRVDDIATKLDELWATSGDALAVDRAMHRNVPRD